MIMKADDKIMRGPFVQVGIGPVSVWRGYLGDFHHVQMVHPPNAIVFPRETVCV